MQTVYLRDIHIFSITMLGYNADKRNGIENYYSWKILDLHVSMPHCPQLLHDMAYHRH